MYIGDYELESPLMNAGGVVKTPEDVRLMAQTGVGAIVAGSFTLEPRAGNSPHGETVYYHDPAAGITYNSLGMPNKGLAVVAAQLPEMVRIAHDAGKPFVLNFAPVTHDPVGELKTAASYLAQANVALDGFELNASCPNVVTPEGRHDLLSNYPDRLEETLAELSNIAIRTVAIGTLLVRVSPLKAPDYELELVKALESVDAVSAFNTFPAGRPQKSDGADILQVPGGVGGQSGAGMASSAETHTTRLVAAVRNYMPSLEIVGSNGITDAVSMHRRLEQGVSAVSATTLFYESPNWKQAVDKLLHEYAELVEQ